jgi:hypothetical protein
MQALRWLVGVQTSPHGQLRPIGSNGFYMRNGARADFDQQPIEAQTTVSACLEAYRATSDPWWYEQAQCAFDWFLGWNDLGLELYCPQSGGCRDGLHADRSSENQGAESTLAFLLLHTEMRLTQNTAAVVQRAGLAARIAQRNQSTSNAARSLWIQTARMCWPGPLIWWATIAPSRSPPGSWRCPKTKSILFWRNCGPNSGTANRRSVHPEPARHRRGARFLDRFPQRFIGRQ